MRVLLDSHTLIWAVEEPARISHAAMAVLSDPGNELLISAGTLWEIAIKAGLKKLTLSQPFRPWIEQAIDDVGLAVLAITVEHADVQAGLTLHHKDPFDRLLAAQSRVEGVPIVSADTAFDAYGIARIW